MKNHNNHNTLSSPSITLLSSASKLPHPQQQLGSIIENMNLLNKNEKRKRNRFCFFLLAYTTLHLPPIAKQIQIAR
jgi:hypothetical protein